MVNESSEIPVNTAIPLAGENQSIRIYSEEEDQEFYLASLIGYHYREKYNAFIANVEILAFAKIYFC